MVSHQVARGLLALCLLPLTLPGPSHAQEEGNEAVIADGSRVSIEYTLTTGDGEVADTNVGEEALVYEQGSSQILPALESAMLGLSVGDAKQVTIPPERGYGAVDPELFQTIPASAIPEEAHQVGAQLMAESQAGQRRPVRVHEIKGEEIVIDLNHPLAGETLHFDVKIVAIE
jgi:FKBP-type peptidyl-prolyl cis-trans isomerase SlyD